MTTQSPTRGVSIPVPPTDEHAFVHVDPERCVGCQECIIRCPTEALRLDHEHWIAEADDRLCVGCRQCERVCPFSAVQVTGPIVVAPRTQMPAVCEGTLLGSVHEVKRGFQSWREAVVEADRCLSCPDPTCLEGCPAHNDIRGFIAAVRDRDLSAAHSILRETSVLPDICSRVCDQSVQCEGACTWALAGGEPVAIGRLERFITDRAEVPPLTRNSSDGLGLTVTVVGSGPAGCAAAWWLLAGGASVTMLEQDECPGGVLRWGIPDFTLPAAIAERPIQALLAAGLNLRTGTALGKDVALEALLAENDAVILAQGATVPIVPPIPGTDLPGTEDATAFLDRAKGALLAGELLPEIGAGARVLVIGGGNTAMDVARTVRRLGAEAIAVEWMDERFTRVRPDELAEARGRASTFDSAPPSSGLRGTRSGSLPRFSSGLGSAASETGPRSYPGSPSIFRSTEWCSRWDIELPRMWAAVLSSCHSHRSTSGMPYHHADGWPAAYWRAGPSGPRRWLGR